MSMRRNTHAISDVAALLFAALTPPTVAAASEPGTAGCAVPSLTPNAPGCYYTSQTGLSRAIARVGRSPIEGVRIASVSSGLAFTVTSLADAVLVNSGESGRGRQNDGVDNDRNGYVDDSRGFDAVGDDWLPRDSRLAAGSFSASLWVGRTRDAFGRVTFQGFLPGARVIPVRVLDENGLTTIEITRKGLAYAAARKAKVVHLEVSLRTRGGEGLCESIRALGEAGALVVAPAGNTGGEVTENDFPAACDADNLVVVAATDASGGLARFSSYGAAHVDVAAPGVDVSALDDQGRVSLRTGTSAASAIVTAAAALLRAVYPSETPATTRKRLLLGADDNAALYGRVAAEGRLNVLKALDTSP